MATVDWSTSELRQVGKERRTCHPVTCACGRVRWLRVRDARKVERDQSLCFQCSQKVKAQLGFQAMVNRWGWRWAMRHVQAYRLANPTTTEQLVGTLLDSLNLEYVPEYQLATKASGRKKWVCLIDFMIVQGGQCIAAIEINGGVHTLPNKIKNDKRKARLLKRRGIPLLILTTEQVDTFDMLIQAFLGLQVTA